jgi:hypothetical protein
VVVLVAVHAQGLQHMTRAGARVSRHISDAWIGESGTHTSSASACCRDARPVTRRL